MISASKCRPLNSVGRSRLIEAEAYQAAGTADATQPSRACSKSFSASAYSGLREIPVVQPCEPDRLFYQPVGIVVAPSCLGGQRCAEQSPATAIGMAEVRAKPIQESYPIS